jgi:phenylalanyl-tRNA synthetase beta chain
VDPDVAEAFGIEGRVGWIEAELGVLLPTARTYVQAEPVSKLPSSDVDLAFVVDDATPAAAVEATLRRAAGTLLAGLRLFDVFRDPRLGEGRRSLAYRLRFQALDHTLTDAEIADVRRRCVQAVESEHLAHLRG